MKYRYPPKNALVRPSLAGAVVVGLAVVEPAVDGPVVVGPAVEYFN